MDETDIGLPLFGPKKLIFLNHVWITSWSDGFNIPVWQNSHQIGFGLALSWTIIEIQFDKVYIGLPFGPMELTLNSIWIASWLEKFYIWLHPSATKLSLDCIWIASQCGYCNEHCIIVQSNGIYTGLRSDPLVSLLYMPSKQKGDQPKSYSTWYSISKQINPAPPGILFELKLNPSSLSNTLYSKTNQAHSIQNSILI